MARKKFNGTKKTRVTWNSMGKGYSYNVDPGETIAVPDDQVQNICGCGHFIVISSNRRAIKPSVVKKSLERDVKPNPVVKVLKPVPVPEKDEDDVVGDVEDNEVDLSLDVPEVSVKRVDYTAKCKKDLKDLCKENGLHVSGNRDDLITRLCNFDQGVVTDY